MALVYQIPRNCLAALLVAQLAVLAPHLFRLPLWVSAVAIVCAMWRLLLYTGRGFYPSGVLKTLLVIISIVAIVREYGNLFSLEPIIALLITTFALKLIEMKSRRDVLVVIYLAYFVAATHFLFEQGIVDALYILATAALVTGALVALHETEERPALTHAFSASAKLIAQAIPLTVIMFIVFPRIDPLWSVPGAESRAKTGPSDSMSPGDISNLAGSSDLAFRVSFDGNIPPADQLYWRGLVFSNFDGRRWSADSNKSAEMSWKQYVRSMSMDTSKLSDASSYTVTMEASRQPWLYAMPLARSNTKSVLQAGNATLRTIYPLDQRFQYQVNSWKQYVLEPELDDYRRGIELQLPQDFNPKSVELASKMRAESGSAEAYVQAVLQMFNREQFVYTIRPPKLGRHSVDEFLFSTRSGFCEHYASSFVFLMRAAGVPARVVVGYQGGELNPFENYLLVHEFDAHAWTEVWFENRGWQRVDPTAAVAPERVESSINELLAEEIVENSTLPFFNFRELPMLRWARLRWDSVNYSWTKWVLNYDTELQMQVLEEWLGQVNGWRIALFVLLSGGAVLLLVALSLLRQKVKHKLHVIDKCYLQHVRAVERLGLIRGQGEGADTLAARIALQYPELADSAKRIAYLYNSIRYNTQPAQQAPSELQRKLRKEVRQFVRASALQKRKIATQNTDRYAAAAS